MLSLGLILVIAVSAFAAIVAFTASTEPFYVGVTYGGDSITEAQQLIDKVKDYINVFVLASGSLMYNQDAVTEIGDYAVNKGLNFIVYYGGDTRTANTLMNGCQERWNSSFLGLYFNDEPGGKMLDKKGLFLGEVLRNDDGSVTITKPASNSSSQSGYAVTRITFYTLGKIIVDNSTTEYTSQNNGWTPNGAHENAFPSSKTNSSFVTYYPNGTITHKTEKSTANETGYYTETTGEFTYKPDGTVQDTNGTTVTDRGDISQFEPYQQLLDQNPCQTPAKTVNVFLEHYRANVNYTRNSTAATLFTADYALYWFDYKANYSTVFAEFVGNESRQRHIALCRGAAEAFGRDWGVIVTWKYHQEPYLESGDELYADLALAYSAGAKYAIVFNYPQYPEKNTYGIVQDEHFEALENFWNTLHSNPDSFGSNPASVAYVVPADFGFGFRSATDTIWGMFPADAQAEKIYNDVTVLTAKYGAKLDILYDEPDLTTSKLSKYATVYYYNQTVS